MSSRQHQLRYRKTLQLERLEDRHLMSGLTMAVPADKFLGGSGDFVSADPVPAEIPVVQELPLHSLPGAKTKLFLDFNGHFQQETFGDWGPFGGWSNIFTPAYDRDGDPLHFSPGEQDDIRFIWASVAEDYAPFNIDVTTVDPDPGLLHPELPYMRIVISGDSDFTGNGAGGVSDRNFWGDYGSYADSGEPNVSYVFEQTTDHSRISIENMSIAASHEAGHAFGLGHYSNNFANDLRAPIMAESGHPNSERQTWYKMDVPATPFSPAIHRDDMATIASSKNGFGYRPDDHSASFANAAALTVTNAGLFGRGVIEKTSDVDTFRFETGGGNVSVRLTVPTAVDPNHHLSPETIGNLDASLRLYNAQGQLLANDTDPTLLAGLAANLAAGTYYVQVGSYGNYGDVGQYSLFVSESTGPRIVGTQYLSRSQTQAQIMVTFNEPIIAASFTAADVRINGGAAGAGVVSVSGAANGAKTFLVTLNKPVNNSTASARWNVSIGPNVTDFFGNKMDQNKNGIQGEAVDNFVLNLLGDGAGSLSLAASKSLTKTTKPLSAAAVDAYFLNYK